MFQIKKPSLVVTEISVPKKSTKDITQAWTKRTTPTPGTQRIKPSCFCTLQKEIHLGRIQAKIFSSHLACQKISLGTKPVIRSIMQLTAMLYNGLQRNPPLGQFTITNGYSNPMNTWLQSMTDWRLPKKYYLSICLKGKGGSQIRAGLAYDQMTSQLMTR